MPELVAYWAGLAGTGASYEIELTEDDGTFLATAFSAAAGGIRRQQGTLYLGPDLLGALTAMYTQAEKKRKGRERSYTFAMPGTPNAGQNTPPLPPLTSTTLRVHPQVWQKGQPLTTLPSSLHSRVGNANPATATAVIPNAAATVPPSALDRLRHRTADPADVALAQAAILGQLAGCTNTDNPEPYLTNPCWLATRKVEGRRATLYRSANGIQMTNRAQEPTACPAPIEQAALKLPIGTRLDGELVAMNSDGTEAAYSGLQAALAQSAVFIAFDLLVADGVDTSGWIQSERLDELEVILSRLNDPVIRQVEWAHTEASKRAMLQTAKDKKWEGIVFRDLGARYIGGRNGNWVRYKMRKTTIDLIVVGYQSGTGVNADRVGSVVVALYDEQQQLIPVGEVGGGFTSKERDELKQRWIRGETMFLLTATCEGLFAPNNKFPRGALIRPSAVEIRPAGDKQPWECTFASELPDYEAPVAK